MQVDIITYTPEPLRVLWTATRTCKSSKTPQELWDEYPGDEEALPLIKRIWSSKHLSVMEHVSITYAVSDVSRALLAQYSRHRIGISLSVQSQRSVTVSIDSSLLPQEIPSMKNIPQAGEVFSTQLRNSFIAYERLLNLGIPKQDARLILPEASIVNFVTTVNLRSLNDLYQKRVVTPGSQWEIKQMIQAMVDKTIKVMPWLDSFLGTS